MFWQCKALYGNMKASLLYTAWPLLQMMKGMVHLAMAPEDAGKLAAGAENLDAFQKRRAGDGECAQDTTHAESNLPFLSLSYPFLSSGIFQLYSWFRFKETHRLSGGLSRVKQTIFLLTSIRSPDFHPPQFGCSVHTARVPLQHQLWGIGSTGSYQSFPLSCMAMQLASEPCAASIWVLWSLVILMTSTPSTIELP